MTPIRVAVVADLVSESWHSMDLVAEMLLRFLQEQDAAPVQPVLVRPAFGPRLPRLRRGVPSTAERIVHRFWDYPRWLAQHRPDAELFHVVDHSYAHLAHVLPPGRVVVTCHDVDAFLPLVAPSATASRLPRLLVRRVLTGLQRAALVACVSQATRNALAGHALVPEERLVVIPNGTHPSCRPDHDPEASRRLAACLPAENGRVDLLHVGSTAPRKRIEFLLDVFAALQRRRPELRLLRVGGLTRQQRARADALGVSAHVIELPMLDREVLAAAYRHAALVLLPSSREGFGLPLIEALACGTPVVGSDIDVLREVGGDAAEYCPLDDVSAWCVTIERLLQEREAGGEVWQMRRRRAIARGAAFSWQTTATELALQYAALARPAVRLRSPDGVLAR